MAPKQLTRALTPAMTGYNFQQTALIGMLPVLALHLDLGAEEVGLAISAGLIVSAIMTPLLAGGMTPHRLRMAVIALSGASLALIGLLLAPQPVSMAFAILLAIRCVQGTSAATVLAVAQGGSAGAIRPVATLARVQIGPGLGRVLGAALIGPMVQLSVALPVLPALLGAAISLFRLGPAARGNALPAGPARQPRPPWLAALALPFLVHSAIGAGQLGLGPLLAQTRPAEQAATMAGLCLAAGYLALLLVHATLTARGMAMRPAAAALVIALALPLLSAKPLMLLSATALAAGVSGLLIARHLARVIETRPDAARQNAAWQGSALLAGLGTGAGSASLVLPLGPQAPFLLGVVFALISLMICKWLP